MGLIRVFVIFFLGLGAALGAYGTGALDYASQHHLFHSWYPYQPKRSMILRVSGVSDGCTARYAIDNRSQRHVFVVFDPMLAPSSGSGPGVNNGYAPTTYGGYGTPDETFVPADPYPDAGYAPPADAAYAPPPPPQATTYARTTYAPPSPIASASPPTAVATAALPAVAVAPGEEKVVSPLNNVQDAYYGGARCPPDRTVKLQLTECPADDGACVAAVTSAGGITPTNQGDE